MHISPNGGLALGASYLSTDPGAGNMIVSGNVGIGTTTPWGQLSVNPNALGSGVPEFVVGSSTATHLIVDGAGRIGINGTNNQTAKLTINTTVGGDDALVLRDTTNGANARFYFTSPVGSPPDLNLTANRLFLHAIVRTDELQSDTGTLTLANNSNIVIGNSGSIIMKTNVANTVLFQGGYNQDTILRPYSGMKLELAPDGGNVGVGSTTPWGQLSVNPNALGSGVPEFVVGSSTATHFVVTGGGNVGIGTSNPTSKLVIQRTGDSSRYVSFDPGDINNPSMTIGNGGEPTTELSSGYSIFTISRNRLARFGVDSSGVVGTYGGGQIGQFIAMRNVLDDGNGKIGVGSTTPWGQLSVNPNALGSGVPEFVVGSSTATHFVVNGAGNVGIGTTTPMAILDVEGPSTISWTQTAQFNAGNAGGVGAGSYLTIQSSPASGRYDGGRIYGGRMNGGTGNRGLRLAAIPWSGVAALSETLFMDLDGTSNVFRLMGGNMGIGTSTPWKTLSVVGGMAVNGLSASGATDQNVCINPTTKEITYGTSCIGSSARFKHDIETLTDDKGLDLVNALRPVTFTYNGNNEKSIGFIAEEVNQLEPRLVFYEADGVTPKGVRYENFAPIVVKAIQELNIKFDSLISATSTPIIGAPAGSFWQSVGEHVGAWLASATNGITDIFTKTSHQKTLCVGDPGNETCLTKTELDAILLKANQAVTTHGPITPPTDNTSSTTDTVTDPAPTDTSTSTDQTTGNAQDNSTTTSSDSAPTEVVPAPAPEVTSSTDTPSSSTSDTTSTDAPVE